VEIEFGASILTLKFGTSLQDVLVVSGRHCFYLFDILMVSIRWCIDVIVIYIISGNTQEISTVVCVYRMNETGWTWVHFQATPPMSTFSVVVAVLDLESTSANTKGG
jgi:aminopeptidase N